MIFIVNSCMYQKYTEDIFTNQADNIPNGKN